MQFRSVLGLSKASVKRGLTQVRDGNVEPDVVLPEALGWWIECKVGRRTSPRAALRQARDGIERVHSKARPLAVCKDDRETPFVALALSDFLEMLQHVREVEHAGDLPETPGECAEKKKFQVRPFFAIGEFQNEHE